MDKSKILLILFSYLFGTLSPAFFIAKYRYHFDIRTRGSNNPGTTNALRTMGPKVGLEVLILDILKGAIPAYLGLRLYGKDMAAICGFSAVMGHIYPLYLKFKGGKGVAASIGAVSVLNPLLVVFTSVIGITIIKITKMVSLASIVGFLILAINCTYHLVAGDLELQYILYLIVGIMGIYSHRDNIKRIIRGEENKIG